MTDTMIERVARVACAGLSARTYDDLPEKATYLQRKTHTDWPLLDRQEARDFSRSMIEAMREPSDLMGNGLPLGYRPGTHSATQIYRAMIDAALQETKG